MGTADSTPATDGISVVIPCYNSAATIGELTRRLAAVLPQLASVYELVLVNDGSTDATWATIEELEREYAWVRGIDLMRNYGQHNATLCGMREARCGVTVTLDDDLQNPPEEIPKLVHKLREGYDLVYGTPAHKAHSLVRNLGSWITRHAIRIASGQATVNTVTAFRAYRTELRRAFDDYRSPQVIVDVLLTWGSARSTAVTVTHEARERGRSNYGLWRLTGVMLTLWTGYTTVPLRLASLLGFAFVLFGAGVLVYVVTIWATQGSLPGFPFLASTIAIFGGVQLFALGIMGEYLARLFHRSLDRPTYAVRDRPTARQEQGAGR